MVSQHHNACSNAMDNGALNPQQKCEARNETAMGGWKLAIFPGRPLYKNLFEFKQSKGYFKDMIIWYNLAICWDKAKTTKMSLILKLYLSISPEGPIADAHCWMKAGIFPKERASQCQHSLFHAIMPCWPKTTEPQMLSYELMPEVTDAMWSIPKPLVSPHCPTWKVASGKQRFRRV